jgi:hypothetical protein
MNHHARRLVHDEESIVLVQDLQRDIFGFYPHRFRFGKLHPDLLPRPDLVMGLEPLSPHRDMPGLQKLLDLRAREVEVLLRQIPIQALRSRGTHKM